MTRYWALLRTLGLLGAGSTGCLDFHSEALAPDSLPVAPAIIVEGPGRPSRFPAPVPLQGVLPRGLRSPGRLAGINRQDRAGVAARIVVRSLSSTGFTAWAPKPASQGGAKSVPALQLVI
jgi:hypothetical protein